MGFTALVAVVTLFIGPGSEDARDKGEEACWAAYDSARTVADTQRVDNRIVPGPTHTREDPCRCRDVREDLSAVQRHRARQARS
jgi:hypothetical protein